MPIEEERERLVARYLNGDITPEDKGNLIRWIRETPENKKLFFELKDAWDSSARAGKGDQREHLLRLYRKQFLYRQKRIQINRFIYAIAAILIIGIVLGGIFLQNVNSRQKSQVESVLVPRGSCSGLTLADGTKVNLNSDSRLKLDRHFSTNHRVVWLTGEGYFEVKADKKHPFTVKTNKFDITVTGTKFNVASYPEDLKTSATLLEGHINLVVGGRQSYLLQPGEKISFDQQTMRHTLEKADLEADLAWTKNEFIFSKIPFPDLMRRLERWYNVKLVYQSSKLDSLIYSGKFKNQETIWQVLDALKLTSPIGYKKTGFREFELYYKRPV